MKKDTLGDRMKADYENRTRLYLPRRTYTLIRVDGKNFHCYTQGFERPFDMALMEDMDAAALTLCENMTGARLAFVQSDEISVLLTDFEATHTQAWFDGSVQKLASLSASLATAHFGRARMRRTVRPETDPVACFDSRTFTIPDPIEVENYFVWRQQDASRNSVSMTASAHFPHDRLQGKSTKEMQELLWQEKGINWNDTPDGFKRGRCIVRRRVTREVQYQDNRTGKLEETEIERLVWERCVPPIFTQDRDWLQTQIPRLETA